ncbi:hypothetical protein HZI73_26405 (plasmid) [Vallitalea pronyensis]|uniref:Uncharacterized protein n=1 Tax=Vallitalea pronyensis TaxID=1348613 RepID=A0A8J8SJU6_9FIRM|nr:hypothetical protein [Vallitalea pronyensis]QUI25948.1 hypothetical protein HZI73_26405 [Vallitalea pronyensis]
MGRLIELIEKYFYFDVSIFIDIGKLLLIGVLGFMGVIFIIVFVFSLFKAILGTLVKRRERVDING